MIIISHQERILRIADEIVMLANGSIQDRGPADIMLGKVLSAGGASAACCREEELFCE